MQAKKTVIFQIQIISLHFQKYSQYEGYITLPICNLGEKDLIIPGNIKVGRVHPKSAMPHETVKSSNSNACPNAAVQSHSWAVHSSTVQTDPGVHVLDHSPENRQKLDQKNERIKYLKEQLKVSETVLN